LASEAEARVTAVLGPATDPRVETEAVIAAHDLPRDFPPEVAAAARRVPSGVPASATAGRLDLRGLPIVTIDGENARDFDDAVLVESLGTGFRLTVAVADVAHYVPPGSPLDLEARARGTSVYFPDRVLPMLPEELSNGICSLKPDQDRLVKAVRLELDARGRETAVSFHDAVMRSAARLTYTQVRQALVDRDPGVRAALGALVEPLERAEALARLLMARRRRRAWASWRASARASGCVCGWRRGVRRPGRSPPCSSRRRVAPRSGSSTRSCCAPCSRRATRRRRSATSASRPTATPTSPRPSAATRTWSCTASSAPGAYRPTSAPSPRSPRGASAWRWRPNARSWS